eukprot:gene2273-23112_t
MMQIAATPRYNLRSALIVSDDVSPHEDNAQTDFANLCVICQECITDDQNVVTLRCRHRFHGQCLCNHLVHDARCPICRDSPYNEPADVHDESDDEEPLGVSVNQAIKSAKANRKNCSQTDRMLKTICKWHREKKNARARISE